MSFEEWLDEVEVFSLRRERFLYDLDHHKEGSEGSYNRMLVWLKAAYDAGADAAYARALEESGGTL